MSASKYGDSGGFLSNNLTDRNAAESQLLLQQERKSRHLDPMEITQLLIVELEATAKARWWLDYSYRKNSILWEIFIFEISVRGGALEEPPQQNFFVLFRCFIFGERENLIYLRIVEWSAEFT
jgi:hypothetical protein